MNNNKENWKDIETDIDFSKYEPISSSSSSLHIHEEIYLIEGKIYRLLYAIGYEGKPNVEILI
jgi:hypothetical protein